MICTPLALALSIPIRVSNLQVSNLSSLNQSVVRNNSGVTNSHLKSHHRQTICIVISLLILHDVSPRRSEGNSQDTISIVTLLDGLVDRSSQSLFLQSSTSVIRPASEVAQECDLLTLDVG